MKLSFLTLLTCLFMGTAFGAIPKSVLQMNGALQGGQAGKITSLLDVRSSVSKGQKVERIVLDVGDAKSQKLKGRIGYYNVELKNGRQLVVNFSQTLNARFSDGVLQSRLKRSPFIQTSKMFFDPMSQSLTLIFDLKKAAVAKVVSVRGSTDTAKLVIDLNESKR